MSAIDTPANEVLPPGTVLIAGGGPVGLLVAFILAKYDVKSVVMERNKTTTQWPKMDLTNGRSMEILKRLGLAEPLRELGVPAHIPQPVLFSTGLSADSVITQWAHPSVRQFQAQIKEQNDGTQPREAWQRVSQVIFEAWLKDLCDKNPLIDLRYGSKIVQVQESDEEIKTTIQNVESHRKQQIISDYIVGCDGASSIVRQSIGLPLDGGPVPSCVLLIHFKSKDLTRLHKQGQFWHIFFMQQTGLFSGAIIAQDEVDTWTAHKFLPLDMDESTIDSYQAIYETLGGSHAPYSIKVDEILVRSIWRPNIAVARKWSTDSGRVFIAGDAAHQFIPTGGYGLNTGMGDAYDLAWKLAAVINGYAGKSMLSSYEAERRPVALRNAERSGVHMTVHQTAASLLGECDINEIFTDTPKARETRQKIHQHYQDNAGENTDFGIELGYRYQSSVIIPEGKEAIEPEWSPSRYYPTTWPGARPPHVFLSDGTAIFDLFHSTGWTLVTFSQADSGANYMIEASVELNVPMKHLQLVSETHAQQLWERNIVLVRPDQHVAWRGDNITSLSEAREILSRVTGNAVVDDGTCASSGKPVEAFTATGALNTQTGDFVLEKASSFQQQ